jgi:hypothetical protein
MLVGRPMGLNMLVMLVMVDHVIKLNSLKALDSKLGFLRVFAGVVQARSLRGLRTSAGAENTGAAAASQLRSASFNIVTSRP